jgi:hypothetical protein
MRLVSGEVKLKLSIQTSQRRDLRDFVRTMRREARYLPF